MEVKIVKQELDIEEKMTRGSDIIGGEVDLNEPDALNGGDDITNRDLASHFCSEVWFPFDTDHDWFASFTLVFVNLVFPATMLTSLADGKCVQ